MKAEENADNSGPLNISFELQGEVYSLTQNISQSGMLCRTSRQIEEMTVVDIRFALPVMAKRAFPTTWVECSGVVVKCEKKGTATAKLPYEVAIFFDRISERDRRLLASYIENEY